MGWWVQRSDGAPGAVGYLREVYWRQLISLGALAGSPRTNGVRLQEWWDGLVPSGGTSVIGWLALDPAP